MKNTFISTVGQKNSSMMEENEEIRQVAEEDDFLLDKIDEAIKSPVKHNDSMNDKSGKNESNNKMLDDDILNGDDEEFLETLIDQRAEDELLGLEDEQPSYSVEKDLEELFNKVQTENEKVESEEIKVQEEKSEINAEEKPKSTTTDGDFKQDDGLLDECEPPKEVVIEDEQSNEVPSNGDDESNQNGISDQDNESCDENKSNEEQQLKANIEVAEEQTEGDASNTNELVIDENKETMQVVLENASIDEKPGVQNKTPEITTECEDIEMKENVEISVLHQNGEQIENIKNEKEEQNDIEMTDATDANDDTKIKQPDESKLDIKLEMDSTENEKSTLIPPRVRFHFMRKFAKECGKLSRADLEELLLEKVTESIVYKSQCTELRTKFEKQEETIDRLQKRLAVVTKQYNDLDMIHKRVEKDLKERPEGPIQPVRITRAVGLQVFLEKASSNLSNNAAAITAVKGKQVSNSATNPPVKNVSPIIKRSMDLDQAGVRNVTNENEPKRKKCKIITPLRPMLSEKEETSLKMQEANIEKNIRMKVATKVANPAHVAQKISSPNLSVTPIHTNGIQKQASM